MYGIVRSFIDLVLNLDFFKNSVDNCIVVVYNTHDIE